MLDWAKLIVRVLYDRPMRCRWWGLRPVVMCLMQATDGDAFLFVNPVEKPWASMPPQEGIKPGESIEMAALRGARSELGIPEGQLHFRRSLWLGAHTIPEQTGARDVEGSFLKMRGKAYYAALIKVAPNTEILGNPAEIARCEWLSPGEIAARLASNSQRKQTLIRSAFRQLLAIDLPNSEHGQSQPENGKRAKDCDRSIYGLWHKRS